MTDAQLWTMGPMLAVALVVLLAVLFYRSVARLFGVVIVPEDSAGIVNKKYVLVGQNRTLPAGAIIALNGEAGLQADALAPGLHFGLWPWQYVVTLQKFITISQDTIGIVEARDGHPLKDGHVLARRVDCNSFQDARAFLEGGGERGPQMTVIPPGTYRINTALFTVQAMKVLDIPDNMLGVVTTKEGRPLAAGEIASPPGGRTQLLSGCPGVRRRRRRQGTAGASHAGGPLFRQPAVCDGRDQGNDDRPDCQCRRRDCLHRT